MNVYPGAEKNRLWDIVEGDFVAVQKEGVSAAPLEYWPVTQVLPEALIVNRRWYSVRDGQALNGTPGRIIALGALTEEMGPAPTYGEAIAQEQQTREALGELDGRVHIMLYLMGLQLADYQAVPFERLTQAALLLGWGDGTKLGHFQLDGC